MDDEIGRDGVDLVLERVEIHGRVRSLDEPRNAPRLANGLDVAGQS